MGPEIGAMGTPVGTPVGPPVGTPVGPPVGTPVGPEKITKNYVTLVSIPKNSSFIVGF